MKIFRNFFFREKRSQTQWDLKIRENRRKKIPDPNGPPFGSPLGTVSCGGPMRNVRCQPFGTTHFTQEKYMKIFRKKIFREKRSQTPRDLKIRKNRRNFFFVPKGPPFGS